MSPQWPVCLPSEKADGIMKTVSTVLSWLVNNRANSLGCQNRPVIATGVCQPCDCHCNYAGKNAIQKGDSDAEYLWEQPVFRGDGVCTL